MKIQENLKRRIANKILEELNELFELKLFPNQLDNDSGETKYYDAEDLVTRILEEKSYDIYREVENEHLKEDIKAVIEENEEFSNLRIEDVDLERVKKTIERTSSDEYWFGIEYALRELGY